MRHHALPRWFEWWQDHVVLSLLVIAGMILNGLMFAHGIVANIEDPASWGVFHGIIFAAFFAAGSGLTGVALRASATMGRAAREGRWGLAAINLLVSLLFLPLEFWASVTERSLTRVFTPADAWVLQLLGHPDTLVSPTIVAIALASPLILFTWGIVTSPPDETTAEDISRDAAKERARLEAQLAVEPLRAQLRAQQARGLRSVAAAAMGRDETPPKPPTGGGTPNQAQAAETEVITPAPNVVQMTAPRKRQATRSKVARNRLSAEAKVRRVYRPGMSASELARTAHIGKSAASKWRTVLAAEKTDQAAQ